MHFHQIPHKTNFIFFMDLDPKIHFHQTPLHGSISKHTYSSSIKFHKKEINPKKKWKKSHHQRGKQICISGRKLSKSMEEKTTCSVRELKIRKRKTNTKS
ncbi:hypothetical protein Dsin_005863 [Dipteronia sinensis]|uniref:Uncharacterized protein n=1 Tax=Dipteronia sinensis TaxID=43782 RepID=A0AAE0AXA6_9ROSI|nr:hypothetical protein Dsin_005863 [Dipteronia sinensis]